MLNLTDEQILESAIINLNTNHPFYARIMLSLKWVFSEEIPHAATDGIRVIFNPAFFKKIRHDEKYVEFVCCHEINHIIKKHLIRKGSRDHMLWNIACDHQINTEQIHYNVGKPLPANIIEMCADNKYFDWLEEDIYDDLLKNEGKPKNYADFGGIIEAKDEAGNVINPEIIAQKMDGIIASAVKSARDAGKLPGYIEKFILSGKEHKINWRQKLRQFVAPVYPKSVSWERFNRRLISRNLYVPGIIKDGVGNMCVIFDTSGSVSDSEIQSLASELNGLRSDCSPEKTQVIMFESSVYYDKTFGVGETLKIEEIKRGGTNYKEAFKSIKGNPKCVIVLGDLEDNLDFTPPNCPVLWISVTRKKAPWGETTFLDTNE